MDNGITHVVLDNRLSVFLKEIHTAPVISVWNWFRVGSRNELEGITGASHLLEHLVGTRFRYKGMPIFPTVDRHGGVYNAATSLDFTTYYGTLPADRVNIILDILASQMQVQIIDMDEFNQERGVVISERQWHENEPLFRLGEELQALAFRVHSYHHEVIGDLADLQTMQRDDLYRHYRTYYVPNNAVLIATGDFETGAMLQRIQELFGAVPVGDAPPQHIRAEPPQNGEKRFNVEGPGETTYIQLAYRAPAGFDADFFPLTVLDSLLTGPSSLNMFGGSLSNKTSRLYRALVEGELAVSVFGGLQATIDPFLYPITIVMRPDRSPDLALAQVEAEIKRLQDTPPSTDELLRAVKQARAMFAYGSDSITNQAFWLGFSEIFADYSWFTTYLDRLASVKPEDVQRAAQSYLRPQNRIYGVYLPSGNGVAA